MFVKTHLSNYKNISLIYIRIGKTLYNAEIKVIIVVLVEQQHNSHNKKRTKNTIKQSNPIINKKNRRKKHMQNMYSNSSNIISCAYGLLTGLAVVTSSFEKTIGSKYGVSSIDDD